MLRRRWVMIALALVLPALYVSCRLLRLSPQELTLKPGLILYSMDGTMIHAYLSADEQLMVPVPLSKIHPSVVACAISSEDKRFYRHAGVDPKAFGRACIQNVRAGRIVSGASTITMQLARLCDPKPRTIWAKAVEMVRAVQLERAYSKSKILEMYLNHLPFGGNIIGVEAASRVYFGKSAENLNLEECAFLMGIPQSPNRYHPLKFYAEANRRKNYVLARLLEDRVIDTVAYWRSVGALPVVSRHAIPFLAPHFCEWIRNESQGKSGVVRTTLDQSLQQRAEMIVAEHHHTLEQQGIHNISVVVLDNQTRAVRAYVGSQDFFDATYDGQVQGPWALRCPGSALKPFLTLLALEKGDVTPLQKIADVPTHYIGLDPENFYRDYEGMVSIKDALKHSLNVPAVRLLDMEGGDAFKRFLETNGFQHLKRPADYYGLGLVLGGCGVTLLELTNAYATLASGGIFRQISITVLPPLPPLAGEGWGEGGKIYSDDAAYLVSDILKEDPAPGGVTFAFKTGTSANHKDAWCVGYTPDITVGVWCGNFSGESSRFLVGRSAALPVVEKIIRAAWRPCQRPWFSRPDGIGQRQVCALSGLPASPLCPHLVPDNYLPGRTKNHACSIHAQLFVSTDGTVQYCAGCIDGKVYRTKSIERYPPEIAAFYASKGMTRFQIPPHDTECLMDQAKKNDIRILSPADKDRFYGEVGTRVPIKVAATRSGQELYLFMDQSYFGKLPPSAVSFYRPEPGPHKLTVLDENGGSVSVAFEVLKSFP